MVVIDANLCAFFRWQQEDFHMSRSVNTCYLFAVECVSAIYDDLDIYLDLIICVKYFFIVKNFHILLGASHLN